MEPSKNLGGHSPHRSLLRNATAAKRGTPLQLKTRLLLEKT